MYFLLQIAPNTHLLGLSFPISKKANFAKIFSLFYQIFVLVIMKI